MRLYHIKDDYIKFLRTYDIKVAENKNESRPYVGIVLEIDDIKYYAPFSSPKPKYADMRNARDFRKIGGGKYGAINFNNMIPVPEIALIPIDIDSEPDIKYKRLLRNQYRAIAKDESAIITTARELRTLILTDDNCLAYYEKRIKSRCCNLSLLESIYTKFIPLDIKKSV